MDLSGCANLREGRDSITLQPNFKKGDDSIGHNKKPQRGANTLGERASGTRMSQFYDNKFNTAFQAYGG